MKSNLTRDESPAYACNEQKSKVIKLLATLFIATLNFKKTLLFLAKLEELPFTQNMYLFSLFKLITLINYNELYPEINLADKCEMQLHTKINIING